MTPQQSEAVNLGREAGLVLQLARPLVDEWFDSAVRNAVAAFRAGTLTSEKALVFVGKLDAMLGFREELEYRVALGEHAVSAANLNDGVVE